jgi:integrase
MSKRSQVPSYRLHKQSGQAIVTLSDRLGSRKDILLGKYGTPESRAEYARVIAEWEATSRRLVPTGPAPSDLSINELALAYWKWAVEYYRWGKRGGFCLKGALTVIKELYGHTAARDFGPLALKACRNKMIALNWSRNYINAQVDRLRRMFRWAASEEMLPGTLYENLKQVEGLRRGKTPARETKKIKPVDLETIKATRPYLPPTVQAMVDFQLLTGSRPTEVCLLRAIDLDMHNPSCWVYRPEKHKREHDDVERLILIGPQAQEVIRPYLGVNTQAYLFSPRAGEEARHAKRRRNRKTPVTPSQRDRRPVANPKRPKRERYDEISYRNAVYRACNKAFTAPEPLGKRPDETRPEWLARLTPEQKEELRRWQKAHSWHPNRLRHTRGTELRTYGLDLAKTVLGHTKVETTQIYAEKDLAAAMQLVSTIG